MLALVGQFYGIERAANDRRLDASARQRLFVYLRDVIERVPTHPVRPVLQLTPREWKRLRKDTNKQAAA